MLAMLWPCKKNSKKSSREYSKNANFDVSRIEEIEKVTHHDVIAFLTNLSENIGEDARFLHQGMTSSDVLDTTLSIQLKRANEILLSNMAKLLKALKKEC